MNTAAIKRLLTILSSKAKIEWTRLYQLIDLAERCYYLKDAQGQHDLGLILQEFPPPFNLIGSYYEGVSLSQTGLFDKAKSRLERVCEHGPEKYRAKALISLGAVEEKKGNLEEAMKFRLKATSIDIPDIRLEAQLGIAVLLGLQGEHQHAVEHLEKFLPVAGIITRETPLYYDYLNSFAVELNDSGRTQEARNVINLVLATSYVQHYPNWFETGKEIYKKSYRSSMVSIPKISFENPILELEPKSETQTASVLDFPILKEAPQPQKPDRLTPQEICELTLSEKRELILAAIRSGRMTETDYDKLMVMVGLLKSGPADKMLDLEDDVVLDNIMVAWSHLVDPEDLADVLSALRDCEDSLRQSDIIDKMIRIAFEETQLCGITEEAWRLRVERRLPKK
jgi:tetratricopeptide (TPR) repeat protein